MEGIKDILTQIGINSQQLTCCDASPRHGLEAKTIAGSDFLDPRDLEIGPDGAPWVLDQGALPTDDDIFRYSFATQTWASLVGSAFNDPRALAFGPNGTLWILDQDAVATQNDLWRYRFRTLTYTDVGGSAFHDPRDIDFDSAGMLWLLADAAGPTENDVWQRDGRAEVSAFVALPGSDFVDPRGLAPVPFIVVPGAGPAALGVLTALLCVCGTRIARFRADGRE